MYHIPSIHVNFFFVKSVVHQRHVLIYHAVIIIAIYFLSFFIYYSFFIERLIYMIPYCIERGCFTYATSTYWTGRILHHGCLPVLVFLYPSTEDQRKRRYQNRFRAYIHLLLHDGSHILGTDVHLFIKHRSQMDSRRPSSTYPSPPMMIVSSLTISGL